MGAIFFHFFLIINQFKGYKYIVIDKTLRMKHFLLQISYREKTNLDIFWPKDQSLTDLNKLPDPDILAEEIIENLQAGLAGFKTILSGLDE